MVNNLFDEKTWEEFRESGILWAVNTMLQHLFGWCIVYDYQSNSELRVVPCKTVAKVFDDKANKEGHDKLIRYLKAYDTDTKEETPKGDNLSASFYDTLSKYSIKRNSHDIGSIIDMVKHADLKYPGAYFDESLYDARRRLDTTTIERLNNSTDWIDQGRNLLVTGLRGSGKTYYVNALAISAMHKNKTVRYTRVSLLMNEIKRIEQLNDADATYKEFMELSTVDILIIDDFGLTPLDFDTCRRLLEILDIREARKTTIVVSQVPVKGWYELFQNDTYADACLDRLTANAFRLEFNGIDMRKSS